MFEQRCAYAVILACICTLEGALAMLEIVAVHQFSVAAVLEPYRLQLAAGIDVRLPMVVLCPVPSAVSVRAGSRPCVVLVVPCWSRPAGRLNHAGCRVQGGYPRGRGRDPSVPLRSNAHARAIFAGRQGPGVGLPGKATSTPVYCIYKVPDNIAYPRKHLTDARGDYLSGRAAAVLPPVRAVGSARASARTSSRRRRSEAVRRPEQRPDAEGDLAPRRVMLGELASRRSGGSGAFRRVAADRGW